MTNSEPVYSVVLPAYLEEENLRLLLPRLHVVLSGLGEPYEIVVVDTVQPLDATAEVCTAQGVRWHPRDVADTFGDAVRTGITSARGPWTIFMDADGSHAPEFIPRLLERLPDADVVIASRYAKHGYSENTALERLMSRLLNVSYALILQLPCKDVSNSFKVYRTDLLVGLDLRCNNFDIIEELLFKLHRNNKQLRITEVPFSFKKRMFGETKRKLGPFMLGYLLTIIKLRFSLYGERRDHG